MNKLYALLIVAVSAVACTPKVVAPVSIIPVPVSVIQTEGSINISDTAGRVTAIIDSTIANPEGYKLRVDDNGIEMRAAQGVGLFYAQMSLNQMVDQNGEIPFVAIEDYPRFGYRGLMLDVSRHFQDVASVKEVLDLMARYKLNRFHWHLTDDQGWRIEIKQYPLLTEIGAWRKYNNQDSQCMANVVKYDNTDFELPAKYFKIEGQDTLYGGFYTQDEIRDVVAYAAERGIEIVPELDMPGHLMAAIRGYAWLSCKGKAQWGSSFSDPLCVGNDSAVMMVKNIYTEVASLFPYEYMHLGADEVEHTQWKACPKCQHRIATQKLKGVDQLQAWFVHDMERHFNSLGKKLIGWDEIIDGGLSPTATIMWWRNWAPDAVKKATSSGNKAIVSPCFSLYFDYYEDETTLRKTVEFNPITFDATPAQEANIMGVQANLWCETIPSLRRIYHQYFPRVLALAEIGWSPSNKRVWSEFIPRLVKETQWLDANGINYRVPSLSGFSSVNVFTDTALVWAECILPNVEIRYTTDGSNPTVVSPRLAAPLVIDHSTTFIFRGFRPDGTAGEMFKADYRKEAYAPAIEVDHAKAGINVDRYHYQGRRCGEIMTKGKKVANMVLDSLNLELNNNVGYGYVGLIAKGYISIEADGIYEFGLSSDDGSMLYVDGEELINSDGSHSVKIIKAQKALAKGYHLVKVQYFENNNGGSLKVTLDDKVIKNFKH